MMTMMIVWTYLDLPLLQWYCQLTNMVTLALYIHQKKDKILFHNDCPELMNVMMLSWLLLLLTSRCCHLLRLYCRLSSSSSPERSNYWFHHYHHEVSWYRTSLGNFDALTSNVIVNYNEVNGTQFKLCQHLYFKWFVNANSTRLYQRNCKEFRILICFNTINLRFITVIVPKLSSWTPRDLLLQ